MSGSSINANLRKKIEQKVSARSISDVRNYYPPFITSSLSFKFFPAIRYIVPIVSTLPFHSLLPLLSLRFNTSIRFIYLFLSFHKVFISLRPSIRFNSYIPFVYLFVLQLVHFDPFRLLLLSFGFHSCISFVASSLLFQLFPSVRYVIPFFRFKSSLPFVTSFVRFSASIPFLYLFFRFKSFITLGPPIRFNSITLTSRSFTCLLRCCNSSISFATSFLWFQLLHFVRCFFPFLLTLSFGSLCHSFRPFVASFLPFQLLHYVPWQSWMRLAGKERFFLNLEGHSSPDWHLQSKRPLAATCSKDHLRPLEWLQVAAGGCLFEFQMPRVLRP